MVFRTRYEIVDGECDITEGISVFPTPGHSPGSQSVVVDTEEGKYVIVGDLICLYACMERSPMIINGLHTNLFEYYDSMNKVAASGYKVLPGHEPKVLDHPVYPY